MITISIIVTTTSTCVVMFAMFLITLVIITMSIAVVITLIITFAIAMCIVRNTSIISIIGITRNLVNMIRIIMMCRMCTIMFSRHNMRMRVLNLSMIGNMSHINALITVFSSAINVRVSVSVIALRISIRNIIF